jgi:periplasmic divalent cation tolerance protein
MVEWRKSRPSHRDWPVVLESQAKFTGSFRMTNAHIVLTTVGSKAAAEQLAQQLVERRLAACVNIVGPIQSIYRWKGKVDNDQEYMLLIKTTGEHAPRLQAVFKDLHPYELPECVQLPLAGGSEEYLAWLAGEVEAGE